MLGKFAEAFTEALGKLRGPRRYASADRKGPRGRLERLEDRLLLSVGAEEQLFVYLVNLARHDPVAYQEERQLSVDLSYIPARGPLAINESLFGSTEFRATEMATYDYFGHQSQVTGDWPNQIVRDNGYELPSWWADDANFVESIAAGGFASYANAPEPLEALIVDNNTPSLGHRHHLLGYDAPDESVFQADNREIGVGYAYNPAAYYEHYWAAHVTRTDPSDRFLTGVIFDDLNGNDRYDLNEGLGGVTVAAGQLNTTTNAHGGWTLEVTPGSYTITASGGGFDGTATATADVDAENVEVDFVSALALGFVDFEPLTLDTQTATTAEDVGVEITLEGVSPSVPQTFAVATQPAHGTLSGFNSSTGKVTYTPDADYYGADGFQFTVAVGAAGQTSLTGTVEIDVTAVNDPPAPDAQSVVVDENTAVELTLSGDDGDPEATQTLSFAVVEPPGHGTLSGFNSSTGKVTYTPEADYQGPDSFRFTVTDDGTAGAPASLTGAAATVSIDVARTLGTIDFYQLADLDSAAGDLWFRFTAWRDGILTAELSGEQLAAETRITLLADDGNGGLAELTGGVPRIDYAEATGGQEYVLRVADAGSATGLALANLVQFSEDASQMTVHGTDGDDIFELTAGDPHVVVVNGVRYESGAATRIDALGRDGNDRVTLTGTEAQESATLQPTSAVVTGTDYEMRLTDFSSITLYGGGQPGEGVRDYAELYDSAGDDNFVGTPVYAAIYGDGFDNRLHGFSEVHVEGTAGGIDVAKFYDSPGNDTYVATPVYNAVFADAFHNQVTYFEGVHVYATAGGIDVAKFYDSPGDDNFVTTPAYAAMFHSAYDGQYNGSFYSRAKFFEGVHAYATAGGTDTARFYDSPANDLFVATPVYAALLNASYQQEYTNGFHNRAKFFEATHAFGTAADYDADVAMLYDSPGDDTFYGDPTEGALFNAEYAGEYNASFYNRAKFFQGVHAWATYGRDDGVSVPPDIGGRDVAYLYGSDGDDRFYGSPDEGALFGPGQFYNRARYFEEVYADAETGDDDRADLYDSPTSDLLEADGNWARLSNAALDFLYQAEAFDYVKATTETPGNSKVLPDPDLLDFELDLDGPW